MATDAAAPSVTDDEWEVKPPPKQAGENSEWSVSAPPSREAALASALGPSTIAASHAQTMAPLTTAEPGALPGTYAHAVKHGYQEPAEEPESQVEGSEIGGYMGALGGVGGGIRSIADKGIRAAAGPIIKGVTGAVAGSAAGGYGGRQIGNIISPKAGETGARIGATVGGLGGGLYGGMGLNEPTEAPPFSKVSESSGPYRGPSSVQSPFEVPASSSVVPEPRIAPGPALPKGGLPAAGPTTFQGGGAGGETVAKPSRTMILTPSEARSEAQMQQLATRRASERGMQFAGGMVPREGRGVPRTPTVVGPVEEYGGPRPTAPAIAPITENRRVAAPGPPPSGIERRRPILGPALPHQVGDEEELARLQQQLKTHPQDAAKIQRAIDDLRNH